MEVVRVETDLTYKVVGRVELKMDIYYPSGSQEGAGHPAVIFVHGDAPVQHNIKNALPYLSWGRLAAASGMAAVTFNRRTSEPGDINDLIQYIREHAETFRIDENRLCVFAFSAGVPLGVTAVLPTPEFVRCIVAYYGDMRMPLSRLQQDSLADIAPFLIAKAARDEFIPSSSIDVFVNEALVRGVDVELLVHPTGVHAFDLRNDDDTSRAIITQTIRFMQAHLEIGQ